MLIIPAIDILNGACVRLYQGDYGKAQEYHSNPVDIAAKFEETGARRIHVVDLDAAKGAGVHNRGVISEIARRVSVEVEVGGGVRSEAEIDALIDAGVSRMILGTVLIRDPDSVAGWVAKYGDTLIAGIDARDGIVKVSGWEENSSLQDTDLARRVAEMGFSSIVYTNIAVDGTLEGPDIEGTNGIAEASGIDVILSAGIGSIADVKRVLSLRHERVIGAIAGKAIYEGTLDLSEALAAAENDEIDRNGTESNG